MEANGDGRIRVELEGGPGDGATVSLDPDTLALGFWYAVVFDGRSGNSWRYDSVGDSATALPLYRYRPRVGDAGWTHLLPLGP